MRGRALGDDRRPEGPAVGSVSRSAGLLGGGRDIGLALRARDLPLGDGRGHGRDLLALGDRLVGGLARLGALWSPAGRADARAADAARLAGSAPSGLLLRPSAVSAAI